jgi:DNA-binding NarL/FixJ family response regulator
VPGIRNDEHAEESADRGRRDQRQRASGRIHCQALWGSNLTPTREEAFRPQLACHISCNTTLSQSIEDARTRERFEQVAYATLPKTQPVSARQANAEEYDGLTGRELEVAALIGQGKSNAEMAALLVVSKRTVETSVSRVLSKLGLTSRSQIALWTHDKGVIPRK